MKISSNTGFLFLSVMLLNSCISLKKRFFDEVEKKITPYAHTAPDTLTGTDITRLPLPVQRHLRYCGYTGTEKITNAFITWDNVYLKMSPEKKWKKIKCYQFNSVKVPGRFDYMKSRFLGIFPFEGSHMYHDQAGTMKIVLMKLFTVVDGKGPEFDQSELVTILSETLFLPAYALQPYITWTAVNDSCAKATLSYDNREVSGLFYFDDNGACNRFVTNDRYYDNQDGTYKKIKWSAVIDGYEEIRGIKYASQIRAIWHTEQGDYEYFKGHVASIELNPADVGHLGCYK